MKGQSPDRTPQGDTSGVGAILKRVVANAGVLLGGRTVNAVLGLAYLAVAGRTLGAAAMGVLVLITAFAQFLGDVVKFQSWQTVIQYGARPLADGDRPAFQRMLRFTLFLDAASTLLGLAIGIVGSFAFADRLGWSAEMAPVAALYMFSIVFVVSAMPTGLLRLFDRFDVLAQQTALVGFVRLLGSGVAWAMDGGVPAFLAAWAAGSIAGWLYLVTMGLLELKRHDMLAGFSWKGPLTEGMPGAWRFAWNTNLSATLDVAFTHVATLVVGAMVGPAQAAFWRVGRQVADAIAKPAKLLTPALYPELARLRAGERHDAMWRLARQVGLLAGGVGLLLLLVAAVAGGPLLALVMGPAFAPAAGVMTWQVGAAVVGILALPLEPMLVSLGKPGRVVWVRLAVGAAFLVALPFLVRAFGLTGAGAGLVGAAAALALGLLWFILRENGTRQRGTPPASESDDSLKGEA
ncbi:lipopolysaccharide biosynthesis protein [Phenylobacterium sp.]|uniref:lipopolysaccharide biosynthesis protein n=1 Tax=Phenylobacterium sp. TaxID=1871053 RepID=UPI002810C863|nr:lipopolysaccharide biosynthesis protein [Phenylobacterium sp.]